MARLLRLVLLLLAVCLGSRPAAADDFQPAYLQLTELDGTSYDVRWKTPARDEVTVLPVRPVYPQGTKMVAPLTSTYSSGTMVLVGRIAVPGGLGGKELTFEGLSTRANEVLVRVVRLDGSEELSRATLADPRVVVAKRPGSLGISARYTALGIEHILFGFDHLLFVAALVLLVADLRALFWTVTSFTIAHSITLALVTLDIISVPRPPVEAFIALSIMFVAVEIIQRDWGRPSLASRRPWLVAFAFGLLHGLGFASALAEIGLPQDNIPLALLFFNVGVEVGQLLFVAGLLAVIAAGRRFASSEQVRRAAVASSYAIGGIASYWLIERIFAFGS